MVSTKLLNIVTVLVNIIVYINCQTCQNASQYGSCSTNYQCGCLQLSLTDNIGVCGLLSLSCSQLSPCQSPNDYCQQSEHICVHHPNCDFRPLCYPLSMANEQVCPSIAVTAEPQIIISNYSSALTSTDGLYSRPGGSSNTYYEAIQLFVPTTGYYDIISSSNMDTHGFLYKGPFDPSNPQLNQIAHNDDGGGTVQFKLPVFLEAGVPYTLVVTTHGFLTTGPFTVVATGPDNIYFAPINPGTTTTTSTQPPIVSSSHSNALTLNSPKFDRNGNSSSTYYYQAYQVRVNRTGNYTFTSSSNMDTYGYIYQGNFYPAYPYFNIHKQNDDGVGNQFKLTAELRSDITYILVVTTFSPTITGPFSITASGPDYVNLIPI